MKFTFCACTADPLTLLENHLFPASPKNPRVAFHLSFLNLYSELRVEGHLSCQAFAAAIATVNKFEVRNPTLISIIGCFIYFPLLLTQKYIYRTQIQFAELSQMNFLRIYA